VSVDTNCQVSHRQTLTTPSADSEASSSSSVEKDMMVSWVFGTSILLTFFLVSASHITMSPSEDNDATLPSDDHANLEIARLWPMRSGSSLGELLHSPIAPFSQPAAKNCPSGDQAVVTTRSFDLARSASEGLWRSGSSPIEVDRATVKGKSLAHGDRSGAPVCGSQSPMLTALDSVGHDARILPSGDQDRWRTSMEAAWMTWLS